MHRRAVRLRAAGNHSGDDGEAVEGGESGRHGGKATADGLQQSVLQTYVSGCAEVAEEEGCGREELTSNWFRFRVGLLEGVRTL